MSDILHDLLKIFLMSMLPISELRGSIPFGLAHGIPWPEVMAIAVIGNILPAPLIMLFARYVLGFLKRFAPFYKIIHFLEERAMGKAKQISKYQRLGLFLLVAIPLPGTGAWTGSLVAAFLQMRLKHAIPIILAGLIVSAIVVTGISMGIIHLT